MKTIPIPDAQCMRLDNMRLRIAAMTHEANFQRQSAELQIERVRMQFERLAVDVARELGVVDHAWRLNLDEQCFQGPEETERAEHTHTKH